MFKTPAVADPMPPKRADVRKGNGNCNTEVEACDGSDAQAASASASQGEFLQIPQEAVCKTCGCRDERPIPDSDRCAGCEAMADLGEAFAFYPTEHPTHRVSFLRRIRSILRCYWQRVGVSRPEPGITAPRPGDRVVINGREMIVPDPPSSSGEEEERDFHPRSWV